MSIILPMDFLYLVYLFPCLVLGLFLPYLCDPFFILILITINHIAYILEYVLFFLDDNVDEESEQFSNSKSSASGCCFCLIFVNSSLVLLIKMLLIKKHLIHVQIYLTSYLRWFSIKVRSSHLKSSYFVLKAFWKSWQKSLKKKIAAKLIFSRVVS